MSKAFAQKIVDTVRGGSSDPGQQISNVMALCAAEGVTKSTDQKALVKPEAPAPAPPPAPAPTSRSTGRSRSA